MFIRSKLRHQNPVIILLIVILAVLGLTNVFSTTFVPEQGASTDFWEQVAFWIAGTVIYLIVSILDSRIFQELKVQFAIFLAVLMGLVAVLVVGDVVNGTRRWLNFGGFTLQPSEFAKIIVITFTASVFTTNRSLLLTSLTKLAKHTQRQRRYKLNWSQLWQQNWRVVLNLAVVMSSVILIWKQPSLGNAIIALSIWLLILLSFIPSPRQVYAAIIIAAIGINLNLQAISINTLLGQSGIDLGLIAISLFTTLAIGKIARLKPVLLFLLLIVGIAIAGIGQLGWHNLLSPYQQTRITAFLNPESDPLGSYWQVKQSKIAIASGQVFGKGFLQGTQSSTGLLPFPQTDFAYAAFTEQFGLVGSGLMLLVYYILITTILRVGQLQTENFGRAICTGVAVMFALNIIINIGMNLGLMPVTGVPLPLISYGGSSVFVNLIGLGLVQMIYSQPQIKTRTK